MRDTTLRLHAAYRALAGSDLPLSEDDDTSLHMVDLAEHSGRDDHARPLRWLRSIDLVEGFCDTTGSLPVNRREPPHSLDLTEARLADFLNYQRIRFARGELSTYEKQRLLALPGFSWAPLDEQWEKRLIEYDEFLTHHKRAPRYRSDDPAERSIADWATRQRCRMRAARMPADQVQGFAYVERRAARVGSRMGPRERRTGL